ncbi:MAG: arylsulfatase A-like enzyme, partial [Limisphaerales bacterium]
MTPGALTAAAAPRPNILIITADNLGYGDLP